MISQFLLIRKIKPLRKTNSRQIHKSISPENNSFNCKNLFPQKFIQTNYCYMSVYVCVYICLSICKLLYFI